MLSQPIRSVMEREKVLLAPPETTVSQAAKLMCRRQVGAVMVVEDGRLVGIFTERDAVYRVIAKRLDPHVVTLAEVMTRAPETVSPEDPFGRALAMMHERGFRHAPVVEDGRPVGVVSARNALDPDLEEFAVEAERRRHIRRRA